VRRFLAVAVGALGAGVALLVAAPAAHADAVGDAVAALSASSPVYVAPGVSEPKVDADAVRSAIGSRSIRIAVLPADNNAYTTALQIGQRLGGRVTVGVVAGHNFNAASNSLCQGVASTIAKAATDAHLSDLRTKDDVTSTLRDFAGRVDSAPQANTQACGQSSAGGRTDVSAAADENSPWPWVIGLGAVGAAGAGGGLLYARNRRRKRAMEMEGRRAEVLSLYDRLGADVQNLAPGDDPVARQALVDASERYTATGSLLSHADTPGEYNAARRTALEGLQAARTVRAKLGLDPGPELPPIAPASGEQLTAPREVAVAGKTYQGYPDYTPGAPYYYGGGAGYPGGWYSFPFWETVLLGSVLSGGFGGGWGGGGYDAGYDRGYDAGQDAGDRNDSGDGGGGWGGGDWGGGGGGGGWGGGDWGGGGGGGGDWGGGGDSGGGSW
jgi:hypothetical protein